MKKLLVLGCTILVATQLLPSTKKVAPQNKSRTKQAKISSIEECIRCKDCSSKAAPCAFCNDKNSFKQALTQEVRTMLLYTLADGLQNCESSSDAGCSKSFLAETWANVLDTVPTIRLSKQTMATAQQLINYGEKGIKAVIRLIKENLQQRQQQVMAALIVSGQ